MFSDEQRELMNLETLMRGHAKSSMVEELNSSMLDVLRLKFESAFSFALLLLTEDENGRFKVGG